MSSIMTTTSTSSSFHLPQHTQLLQTHTPIRQRQLDIITPHSCQPPPPQNKTYYNPTTNETKYFVTEVEVHEIGILFDYEIRHASGVSWEKAAEELKEEEKKSGWGWKDKISNFFGRGDDEEDEEESKEEGVSSTEEGGGALLEKLEQIMAESLWDEMLKDKLYMTWDAVNTEECAGLIIEDDTRRLQRKRNGGGIALRNMEEEDDEYDDDYDYEYEYEDDGVEAEAEAMVMREEQQSMSLGYKEDILDGSDSFTGTRLLGLTHLPLDYVNQDGCTIPDSTCTSIRGQLSVAYAGTNEYGVTQSIISRIQSGMDAGTFISSEIPVLNLEFTGAGGTFAPSSGGNGGVISLNTARGTEPLETGETEEDPLSRYGVLFVCLVGILGAGFIAAMVVRYRKRKRKLKEANEEDIEMRMEDYEANLALEQIEEDIGKTEGDSSSVTDSPGNCGCAIPVVGCMPGMEDEKEVVEEDVPVINQVELDVPPMDGGLESNEIEISLTGSKSWSK